MSSLTPVHCWCLSGRLCCWWQLAHTFQASLPGFVKSLWFVTLHELRFVLGFFSVRAECVLTIASQGKVSLLIQPRFVLSDNYWVMLLLFTLAWFAQPWPKNSSAFIWQSLATDELCYLTWKKSLNLLSAPPRMFVFTSMQYRSKQVNLCLAFLSSVQSCCVHMVADNIYVLYVTC